MISAAHAAWLESRGIDLEIATRYGVHTDKDKFNGRALAFPFTRNGRLLKHKYRLPDKHFVQDSDAPHAFFNEDCLRDPTLADHPLIITEGEIDALTAIQCGFPRTVSVDGGANSNLEFLERDIADLLKSVQWIILGGDGDDAGRALNAHLARRLEAPRCWFLTYPTPKDLNDVLQWDGREGVEACINAAKPMPIKGLYRLSDYAEVEAIEVYNCGFMSLHQNLRLFHGEVMAITGIPGYGKSRFVLSMAELVRERHSYKATICSPEMRVKPYVRDVLREQQIGKWVEAMTPEEKRAADGLIEENFRFIDPNHKEVDEPVTLEWTIDRMGYAVGQIGARIHVVDPWNQLEHRRDKYEGPVEYQCRALTLLRKFATTFDSSVWIVCHPTKEVRQKNGDVRKPTLYDIDGSAHWYNSPDHGLVVHGDRNTNIREVDVQKSRYRKAGKLGAGHLKLVHGQLSAVVAGAQPESAGESASAA